MHWNRILTNRPWKYIMVNITRLMLTTLIKLLPALSTRVSHWNNLLQKPGRSRQLYEITAEAIGTTVFSGTSFLQTAEARLVNLLMRSMQRLDQLKGSRKK